MVSFGEAISNGFRNYVNFTGRSTRAEYWWWYLFSVLVGIAAAILDAVIFPTHTYLTSAGTYDHTGGGVLFTLLVYLGLLLPTIAVSIRRLRDTAHRWGWYFIGLVPFVGPIILIVFFAQPTSPVGWGEPTSIKNPAGTSY